MNIPAEFDEIRPYSPEELPAVYEELTADADFRKAMSYIFPDIPFPALAQKMKECTTNLIFQKSFCYPFIKQIMAKASTGMELDCSAIDPQRTDYTFISNHRDIVLDSGLLDVMLVENGHNTIEIAIGDNLLIFPWIKKLVRINKSFIVQRALTMRQMLQSSARMSRYMHFAVQEKKEGIWIAQREGRAKDSNDLTQDSILKMMAMGGEGDLIDRLKALHITPLSISYEYDPCDFLKAQEFQQKRDNPEFKKSQQDDLTNMQTGIFGYKGHVHFHMAPCIDPWLDTLDRTLPKTELFALIARHIDREIHRNYRLYPGNYVAAHLLNGGYTDRFTPEEQNAFEVYLAGQLKKIQLEKKDEAFLRERMLTMYANPVFNNEKA